MTINRHAGPASNPADAGIHALHATTRAPSDDGDIRQAESGHRTGARKPDATHDFREGA